jgi:hypothetical protein
MGTFGFTRRSGENSEQNGNRPAEPRGTCHRDRIVDAPHTYWMEFQAAYIGGALLMPSYSVKLWAGEIAMRDAKQPPMPESSDLGLATIERLIRRCRVSEQGVPGSPHAPRPSQGMINARTGGYRPACQVLLTKT